jgi:hypothetical protein
MPAAFLWLRQFLGLNAFGVYRFAVSMGYARFWVSMPAAFEWLRRSMPSAFIAALFQWAAPVSWFNFVEGFAVQCLRRLSLRCLNGFAV